MGNQSQREDKIFTTTVPFILYFMVSEPLGVLWIQALYLEIFGIQRFQHHHLLHSELYHLHSEILVLSKTVRFQKVSFSIRAFDIMKQTIFFLPSIIETINHGLQQSSHRRCLGGKSLRLKLLFFIKVSRFPSSSVDSTI